MPTLSTYLHVSINLPIYLSIHPSIYPSIHPHLYFLGLIEFLHNLPITSTESRVVHAHTVNLSTYMYLSTYQSIYPSIHPSIPVFSWSGRVSPQSACHLYRSQGGACQPQTISLASGCCQKWRCTHHPPVQVISTTTPN